MKTAAQRANAAKIRIQQELVSRLREGGRTNARQTWEHIRSDSKLWNEVQSYDLGTPQRQSHLTKVAFPDENHDDVAAALAAGNNLNRLYALACGLARLEKDAQGRPKQGKRGLAIRDLT